MGLRAQTSSTSLTTRFDAAFNPSFIQDRAKTAVQGNRLQKESRRNYIGAPGFQLWYSDSLCRNRMQLK